MNLRHYVYITVALYSIHNITHVHGETVYKIDSSLVKCSRLLSVFMHNLCEKTFKIVKRDTSRMIESMAPEGLKQKTYKQLFDKRERRRVRRQIASECCNEPCTIATFIEYCPSDSRLILENSDLFE